MEDGFKIIWRNVDIGRFEVSGVDMWYLEGNWVPNNTKEAESFEALASNFNVAEVWKNPTKGTKIILKSESDAEGIHSLVLSLQNKFLSVRQVMTEDAVKWLIKNVK